MRELLTCRGSRLNVALAVAAILRSACIGPTARAIAGEEEVAGRTVRAMGALPSPPEAFDRACGLRLSRAVERPAELLLTRYLPPVANQGRQSSCVGWSTAYCV